ncbi:unnamed protein product [Durusdinium trenchii]|uniref:tRNA(Ile)-lysidine synthetase n=1 Tax=Durusdinium trenchii TaxID=1381693 RepID=A0ABP0NB86_9DINO
MAVRYRPLLLLLAALCLAICRQIINPSSSNYHFRQWRPGFSRSTSLGSSNCLQELSKSLELPFFVRYGDPQRLKTSKLGLQAAARDWRQGESKALLSALEKDEDGVVLLAHHADDQVETQLLKLLRGGHLARLGGMRAREGPFARPLLSTRKDELKAFLCEENQSWMEDASNAQPVYQRNRVRLELVPMLVDLLGGKDALHNRFQEIAQQSGQLSSLLEELCEQNHGPEYSSNAKQGTKHAPGYEVPLAFCLDVSSFQDLPEMVQYEFVWRFVSNACGAMLSHSAVGSIVRSILSDQRAVPFTWLLGSGWELKQKGSQLLVLRKDQHICERTWKVMDLFIVHSSPLHISMQLERSNESFNESVNGMSVNDSFESKMILHGVANGSTITLRGAQPGDHVCPRLGSRAIKLTSFLHRELGVVPSARPNWPVITIKAPGGEEVIAAVLPDRVAGGFQVRARQTAGANRSTGPSELPAVVSLSWSQSWPGLEKSVL